MLNAIKSELPLQPNARSRIGETSIIDQGSGEPLVFIHGVGLNANAWQPQIDEFSKHYRVIALDLLGHGGSKMPPPNASLDNYIEQVRELLDDLKLSRANIIGHSMGGLIAIGFALAHPTRTSRIGVLNSVYERDEQKSKAVQERANQILHGGAQGDIDEPIQRWFENEKQSKLADQVRGWLAEVNPVGYGIAYNIFAKSDRAFSGQLSNIIAPILFATGSKDPNSTADMASAMAAATPNGYAVTLDGERHMMNLTAPAATNEIIKNLLDRPTTSIDPRELRNAFGSFMTGITVVTTREENGNPRGFTANSFTSVSLDPPLLLICIGKSASSYSTFTGSTGFAVNILSEQQKDVSGIFASKRTDKFNAVKWHSGQSGNPILDDTVAHFDCRKKSVIDAGDHVILIGEITQFGNSDRPPLGYFRGNYVTPSLERDAVTAAASHGKSVIGIILEYDGKLLLLPNGSEQLSPPQIVGGTVSILNEGLRGKGLDIDLGFIFAVFENPNTKVQSIWYRGYAKGQLPPEARLVAFDELEASGISDEAVSIMLRRYADERTNGRFRIYAGDHERGEIKSVE